MLYTLELKRLLTSKVYTLYDPTVISRHDISLAFDTGYTQ